ncbi:glucose-6-phosphate isomerase, partial [Bacillus cereus]|nr:glucose-6-phosphate isomerase [Bacillus cereus]
AEWWKQVFGEKEGQDQKGFFPSSAKFSTDLHSLGQYVQEGRRDLFETVLKVGKSTHELTNDSKENDLDELNYLVGETVDLVNTKAYDTT